MDIVQLIYVSQIVPAAFCIDRPLDRELEAMLVPARVRNESLGLTGLLIYSGGHFLQVLEGHPRVLERLFSKIALDPRHRNVKRLAAIDVEVRMFSKWQMGLLNLDERVDLDSSILERFIVRLESPFTQDELANAIFVLLKEFKSSLETESSEVSTA